LTESRYDAIYLVDSPQTPMSAQAEILNKRDDAVARHRLAYPAFPAEVANASRQARKAMRWPMVATAMLILLGLTATIAVLVVLRPASAAAALIVSGGLLLFRTRRPGQSYDSSIGWVYRYGIIAGVAGELAAITLFKSGATPIPSWLWVATDALGVGGAIGLGVALAGSASVVVLTFLHAAATLRPTH
jgi:hypothetical protein